MPPFHHTSSHSAPSILVHALLLQKKTTFCLTLQTFAAQQSSSFYFDSPFLLSAMMLLNNSLLPQFGFIYWIPDIRLQSQRFRAIFDSLCQLLFLQTNKILSNFFSLECTSIHLSILHKDWKILQHREPQNREPATLTRV